MPYEISWHTPNRIIYERLYGNLTVDDARGARDATEEHIAQGQPPIHLIIDASGMSRIPVHIRESGSMNSYLTHPSVGWVIVITGSPLTDFFVTVTAQLVKFRLGRAKSIEEALEFIRKNDDSI